MGSRPCVFITRVSYTTRNPLLYCYIMKMKKKKILYCMYFSVIPTSPNKKFSAPLTLLAEMIKKLMYCNKVVTCTHSKGKKLVHSLLYTFSNKCVNTIRISFTHREC